MTHKMLLWVMAAMLGATMAAAPALVPAQIISTQGPVSPSGSSAPPTAGPVDGPPPPTTATPTSNGTTTTNNAGPCGVQAAANGGPLVISAYNALCLIQPLDDSTYVLQPRNGIQIAFDYFNLSFPWLVGVAAGFAVLQGVVAGVQIMYGGSPDKIDEGKTRFIWALGGMLLLGLAGVILRALNPIFFR